MQLIFEDEVVQKCPLRWGEDEYLGLLSTTSDYSQKWRKHCIYQYFRHF